MTHTTLHLRPHFFDARERPLVEAGSLSASALRFDSGVCALRLQNARGHLLLLPFQGQQIWSAHLDGRELTMRTPFNQGDFTGPRNTQTYLHNYGGFLLHCGAAAMGVPGPEDDHPLHGELPNAPYQAAAVVLGEDGEDGRGPYIGLTGRYQHTVAFGDNYLAQPLVKLYADSALFDISMTVTNLKQTPMELMYLAHLNFRPVDNGRIVYSAPLSPQTVRVRRSIPSHVKPTPEYVDYLETLASDPAQHHTLSPDKAFDPEVVFSIDYAADGDGWAHSMQVHPNGDSAEATADYVRHRVDSLAVGVRWICRTPDKDALGLVLPATAEPEGYTAEKVKGNVRTLKAGETFCAQMSAGVLSGTEVEEMETKMKNLADNRIISK